MQWRTEKILGFVEIRSKQQPATQFDSLRHKFLPSIVSYLPDRVAHRDYFCVNPAPRLLTA